MYLGDNGVVEAIGKGSMLVETCVDNKMKRIRIHDVLHVPKLHTNLLSVSKLVAKGFNVHFNTMGCKVRTQRGEVVAIATIEANLYQLDLKVVGGEDASARALTSAHESAMELWHKTLGHLRENGVKVLQSMVVGMDLGKGASQILACEGCVEGKQARTTFPSDGGTRATQVLKLVLSDVCGPMKTLSFGGARYFVTFIDYFQGRCGCTSSTPMMHRSNVSVGESMQHPRDQEPLQHLVFESQVLHCQDGGGLSLPSKPRVVPRNVINLLLAVILLTHFGPLIL